MKFNKHQWERHKAVPSMTREMLEAKVRFFDPKAVVEKFEILSSGLANINVYFKLTGINDSFLLRIYNRDNASLNLEMLLSQKFGQLIPMPEFLHVQMHNQAQTQANVQIQSKTQKEDPSEHSFVIQKWFDGIPFYKILEAPTKTNLCHCAKNIANVLSNIAAQKFPEAGFLKGNVKGKLEGNLDGTLEIEPYDIKSNHHPFISYIEDCLFNGYSGKNLGNELRDTLWDYVIKNQDYFPAQEPACLVHGDFNFDNILIDAASSKVVAVLDWEFAFAGSYLFDIGTFLRFELPIEVKNEFINAYQHYSGIILPNEYEKMIKIQDLANFVGLINHPTETPDRLRDVKYLIQETLTNYP